MSEICSKCGLPKELCVCQEIAKEAQKIKISVEKKKFKKLVTLIEGFDSGTDFKSLVKELKHKLACGGTSKDGYIVLQGDHRDRAKELLVKLNYSEDQINVL